MPRARTLSHLIMVTALSIIMHVFIEKHKLGFQLQTSKLWTFSYLLSFSVHFGTQVWMTLVSGKIVYINKMKYSYNIICIDFNILKFYYRISIIFQPSSTYIWTSATKFISCLLCSLCNFKFCNGDFIHQGSTGSSNIF